jgi:hypothetical protein
MAEHTRDNDEAVKGRAWKGVAPDVVSVARRRVVQAGLTAPIILTLRSKPLFGQTVGCSAWMSATYLSHHQYLGPEPEECKSE